MTIRYKGFFLFRYGSRVLVVRADADKLGSFPGWAAAMAFVDRLRGGVAPATLEL